MSDGISISGTAVVQKGIDAFVKRMQATAESAIGHAVETCYDGSQTDVPVRRGDLKASGAKEHTGLSGSVRYGNDKVTYAWPVEVGHRTRSGSFVPAHPYLLPNFLKGKRALFDELHKP